MKKILLVEDDAAIAELERDYLEADGFAVDISADGDAGKRLAMTRAFNDLVFLPTLDVVVAAVEGRPVRRRPR